MSQSSPERLAGGGLASASASYVEALYEQYLQDPASVGASWRGYFDALSPPERAERARSGVTAEVAARTRTSGAGTDGAPAPAAASEKQAAVSRLMQIYGNRGHLVAH